MGEKHVFSLRNPSFFIGFMFRGVPHFRGMVGGAHEKHLSGDGKQALRRSYLTHYAKKGAKHTFPTFLVFPPFSKPTDVQAPRGPEGTIFENAEFSKWLRCSGKTTFSHETRRALCDVRLLCFVYITRCHLPKTQCIATHRFSGYLYVSRRS